MKPFMCSRRGSFANDIVEDMLSGVVDHSEPNIFAKFTRECGAGKPLSSTGWRTTTYSNRQIPIGVFMPLAFRQGKESDSIRFSAPFRVVILDHSMVEWRPCLSTWLGLAKLNASSLSRTGRVILSGMTWTTRKGNVDRRV